MTWRLTFIGLATALTLAGCGGGDTVEPPRQVYVAGDSLNDVGVFGVRYTVQNTNPNNSYKIWTEHVASGAGVDKLCAAYNGMSGFAPVATCTGHAVGGAQINPVSLQRTNGLVSGVTIDADNTPMSIVQQIRNLASGRVFADNDLFLVDGGGNDANALALSLLQGLNPDNPLRAQALAAYATILKDLLDDATVDAAVTQATANNPTALIQLGGAYMQTAATLLSSTVKTELLARGAQRVVVLNLPDLAKTPGLNGATGEVKAIVGGWSRAMNAQLQTELGSESRVLVVDFYAALESWVSNPASASVGPTRLSNVTDRACGDTAITSCTDTGLDADGPQDWRTHLFADNLHSTPFGNQLLANLVQARMTAKGWN